MSTGEPASRSSSAPASRSVSACAIASSRSVGTVADRARRGSARRPDRAGSSRRRRSPEDGLGAGDRFGADSDAVDDPPLDGLVVGQHATPDVRALRRPSPSSGPGTSASTGRSRPAPGGSSSRPLGICDRSGNPAGHAGAGSGLRTFGGVGPPAACPSCPSCPWRPCGSTALRPTACPSGRPSTTSSCGPRRTGRRAG